MTRCDTCDFIGPELDEVAAEHRALHRAAHELVRHLADTLAPVIASLNRLAFWLHRITRRPAP